LNLIRGKFTVPNNTSRRNQLKFGHPLCGRRVGIRVGDPEAPIVQLDVATKDHLSDGIIYGHRQR
jgi:hypothetical protein